MANKIVTGLTAFVLCCGAALAQDDDEKIVPATIDELLAAISDVLDERDTPGVALAIVNEDGPEWIGALGQANVENDIAADADTLFRIGSTSKVFVSLSVLQLVEEGRLSLDDKVSDLVPEIAFENPWEETHPVRVAHLLEHTTGWDDIHLPEYAHNDPTPATLKEGLDYHPHSRTSRWQPGTRMAYCNAGPPVAAYIVQKITGQDFEDYVQENFFTPLQMTGSTYRRSERVQEIGASLYVDGVEEEYWHISMRPSGAINASASDMARLLQMFLGRGALDGVQYISPESLDRMETAHTTNGARAGLEVGYGLSNYTSAHEHWTYQAHNGGVNGGLTEFAYLPDANRGYAFMINSGSGAAFGDISDLIRNYQTRDLAEPGVPDAVPVNDQAIAGLYHPINSRQQISYFLDRALGVEKLWFEDGELKRKALLGGDATGYKPAGNDQFRSPETGRIVLLSAEDAVAGPVVHAGNLVLKPVSPIIVFGQLAVGALWLVSIGASFLYFLVWGIRKWRGKVPKGASTRIRVWPLFAGFSVVAFVVLFAAGMSSMSDIFSTLGKPTTISVGIMLATIAFAIFAVLGVRTAITERNTEMNRFNYWYCSISSYLHLLVVVYLLWFGVIGIQTWA
jgi:CubicO group peptidase (beta-lactamase class C family)/succinate dehydrogenase/fumarate reductase cytochrome b subunit